MRQVRGRMDGGMIRLWEYVGFALTIMTPLVLGPEVIPVITERAMVLKDPALTLLSALSDDEGEHGHEMVLTVEQTFAWSSHEVAKLFFGVICNRVREPRDWRRDRCRCVRRAVIRPNRGTRGNARRGHTSLTDDALR